MSKTVRTEAVDHLFEAILTLESKEECYTFFQDVCTINELLSLSQRYEVAKMLREAGYREKGLYVPLSNGEQIADSTMAAKWEILCQKSREMGDQNQSQNSNGFKK